MSASDHLNPEQFFAGEDHPHIALNDHHEGLGFNRYSGPIDDFEMQSTNRRVTITPQMRLNANQPTVTQSGVRRYLDHPSNHPIDVYHDPEFNEHYVIDGHHRAVARRLRGEPVEGRLWEYRNRKDRR